MKTIQAVNWMAKAVLCLLPLGLFLCTTDKPIQQKTSKLLDEYEAEMKSIEHQFNDPIFWTRPIVF